DARVLAADARQRPEREGLLDHDGDAPGGDRAPFRRERRPGHGRPRGDLPCGGSPNRDRAEGGAARPFRQRRRARPRPARHAVQRASEMGGVSIRLGRISYVNMAPVFYELKADVEEVAGVPTELNRMLLDGE